MYINFQQAILGASALTGSLYKKQPGSEITSGTILDYCVQKCIDDDGNQRCTAPVLLKKSTKYHIEWSTEGALSHTTMEVRDAKSNEIVYYKDINGDFTAEKTELVTIDFMPKTPNLCNSKVDYTLSYAK